MSSKNIIDQIALPADTIILVVLAPTHFWFNPISSALALTAIGIYIALGFLVADLPDEIDNPTRYHRYAYLLRLAIVIFMLMIATVLPAGLNIGARLQEGPATNAHDGLIQTEIAIDYLLQGKNPYTENYLDTPMDSGRQAEAFWTTTDTPLYHNAYLPALFLISIPAKIIIQSWLGWYDQRILYLLLYLGLMLILPLLVKKQRNKLILLMIVGLNLLFPLFMAEGRNDIVVLFGLGLTTLLLARKHSWLAAIALGVTCATKHSAWFYVPFFLVYLYPTQAGLSMGAVRLLFKRVWPFFATLAVIILPFFFWDALAFIDDTLFYLIGISDTSFPIRGWGFSVLLYGLGMVDSQDTTFPFFIPQLLIGLPLLFLLLRHQWRTNTLTRLWLGFALFSFVVDYFSRFFNDNYVVFVLLALVIGAFMLPQEWASDE